MSISTMFASHREALSHSSVCACATLNKKMTMLSPVLMPQCAMSKTDFFCSSASFPPLGGFCHMWVFIIVEFCLYPFKGRQSYTCTSVEVPELIPVLGSPLAADQSHKPGSRLPLLSASRMIISPAAKHHYWHCYGFCVFVCVTTAEIRLQCQSSPIAWYQLHCLKTEAHVCKQLVQGCIRQHGNLDPQPVDRKSSNLTTWPHSI